MQDLRWAYLGLAGNKFNYDLKMDNREAPNQVLKYRKSGKNEYECAKLQEKPQKYGNFHNWV